LSTRKEHHSKPDKSLIITGLDFATVLIGLGPPAANRGLALAACQPPICHRPGCPQLAFNTAGMSVPYFMLGSSFVVR
jgi:hypothetical protein